MSSRHEFPAKHPGYAVAIGWDNPMSTFFAKVTHESAGTDSEAPPALWLGSEEGDIKTPEVMVEPLMFWFDLTPALVDQLKADRAADAGRSPTPLQRASLDALKSLSRKS